MRTLILAILCIVVFPVAASAQRTSFEASMRASAQLRLTAAPHTPLLAAAPPGLFEPAQRRRHGQGTVFMIVGGAVAVAGILADEGILVVAGVAVAGYGLYLHLR